MFQTTNQIYIYIYIHIYYIYTYIYIYIIYIYIGGVTHIPMIAGALKIYHKCRSMIFAQIRSTSSSEGLVQDPSVPTCRSGSDTPCISMWYVGYVVGWFTEKDLFLRPPISSNMWLIEPRLFTVHAAMAVPHPRVGHGQGFRKQQTIHIIWKHYSHPPKKHILTWWCLSFWELLFHPQDLGIILIRYCD